MRWMNGARAALAVSAMAMAAGSAAAAAHDAHPRPCCPPHKAQHRDQRYARAVIHDHPSSYWRLGQPGGSPDEMGGAGTGATYGTQVTPLVPGAIACGDDVAVGLSGATQDNVWESHVVAGEAAHTIAPGTAHFGIEVWVRPDFLDGNSRRIASRELRTGGYLLAARADALVFSRFVHTGGGEQWSTLSALPLPLHTWTYLVANYDADGVMRLWVNGQLAGELASSLQLPDDPADGTAAGGRFLLGASGRLWNPLDPATHAYLEWDGALDEAAFYGPSATNLSPRRIHRHWRIGSGRCGCGGGADRGEHDPGEHDHGGHDHGGHDHGGHDRGEHHGWGGGLG